MDIQELQEVCRQVRRDIIIMTNKAGAGHPGGSLSATEALVALYFDVMKGIDPKDDKNPNRDRFVLSKGHAAPALYGTLCERGYFGREEFDHFRQLHGILQGHPDVKKQKRKKICHAFGKHFYRFFHILGYILTVCSRISNHLFFIQFLQHIQCFLCSVSEKSVCFPLQTGQVIKFGRRSLFLFSFHSGHNSFCPITEFS